MQIDRPPVRSNQRQNLSQLMARYVRINRFPGRIRFMQKKTRNSYGKLFFFKEKYPFHYNLKRETLRTELQQRGFPDIPSQSCITFFRRIKAWLPRLLLAQIQSGKLRIDSWIRKRVRNRINCGFIFQTIENAHRQSMLVWCCPRSPAATPVCFPVSPTPFCATCQ